MGRNEKKIQYIKDNPEPFADFKKANASSPFTLNRFAIVFISFFFLFPLMAFIWSLVDSDATIHTLTLAYGAFFLGTTFELRKITGNWKNVTLTIVASLLLSLLNFIQYKHESQYSFQNHLDNWPIVFSAIFIFLTIAFYSKKLIAKIGEGVTLLHSLTLLYFLSERFHSGEGSGWWIALAILPVLYSMIHAFTYDEITKLDRLHLSIWSSITMAVFAVVYVQKVLQMDNVEVLISENRIWEGANVFFEYFLLGASGAYITQNLFMLLGYIPSRGRFFNASYFNDVRELNKTHIERYSTEQVDRREAFFVFLLVGGFLIANYFFKLVIPSFAIWLCLIIAPIFVGLFEKSLK